MTISAPRLATPALYAKIKRLMTPAHRDELRALAEPFMEGPGYAVTDKPRPPDGSDDLHDYASLSKYWWPDPGKADGFPWIPRDGERNPASDAYDAPRLVDMCLAVTTLNAAALLGGDGEREARYAERAGGLLRRWFLDSATRMNPHLRFAQFVPGVRQGSPWGIIDAHFFCELLESVRAMAPNPQWADADRNGLRNWFSDYRHWLASDPEALREADSRNNHGAWYDAQYLAISALLGATDDMRRHLVDRSLPRLTTHLADDGGMPEEERRTLSLFYTYFNFQGWSWLAGYGASLGIDVWHHATPSGMTLSRSLERTLPYFFGERKWPYPQIKAGPGMREYCRLLGPVSAFDDNPRIRVFLERFDGNPVWRLPSVLTDDDWQQQAIKNEE